MYEADERIAGAARGYLDWRRRMGDREDVLDYDYMRWRLPAASMALLAVAHGHVMLKQSIAPREIEDPREFILRHL